MDQPQEWAYVPAIFMGVLGLAHVVFQPGDGMLRAFGWVWPTAAAGLAVWSVIQVLVFIAIAGFAVAAWVVFKEASWWQPVAVASAIVGLAALVPYVIGVRQLGDGGDAGVQMNIAIHAVGIAAVVVIAMVPVVHDWIARRI